LSPSGIPGLIQPESLIVFPVPAKACLNLISEEDMKEVRLTSLLGREVLRLLSGNRNNLNIDISGIPDGIYILSVTTAKGTRIKKISIEQK
jgi:hypothetical protein